jgi:hypothetical protein
MQPPQDWQGKHAACSAHVAPDRRVLVQRQVGSDLVVVFLIRCEKVAKMSLTKYDDMIKTFPSDRTDQPLPVSIPDVAFAHVKIRRVGGKRCAHQQRRKNPFNWLYLPPSIA